MSDNDEYKLVVIGGGGVGKSALTVRLVSDKFLDEYDPTIEDEYRKHIQVDGKDSLVVVFDTNGQQDFSIVAQAHLRDAAAVVLVYSITSKYSFHEATDLLERFYRFNDESTPMVLVGNKADLGDERQVTLEDAQALADRWNMPFVETSAKAKINHVQPFEEAVRAVRKARAGAAADAATAKAGKCCTVM